MPTVFTHAVVALAAGRTSPFRTRGTKFWLLALGCSLLPDADVIGFAFDVPYAHPLGHRGFFHSPFFGLLTGLAVTLLFFREIPRFSRAWWGHLAFFSLLTASHGILDAFTDGGLGIALLAPFDNNRYFFPWTPIRVSPIGIDAFLSERGWITLKSELLWIWGPLLLLTAGVRAVRAGVRRRRDGPGIKPNRPAPHTPAGRKSTVTRITEGNGGQG